MKNTINLIKIYFKETLINMFNANSKRSLAKTLSFFVILFSVVAFALGYNFYTMADMLNNFGFAHNILLIGLIFSIFIVLMLTMTDTQGYFYRSKDYEMIASMPIKTTSVIIAKYISSYLVTLLYTSMIAIPTFIVYFIFCGVSFGGIVLAILGLILLPTFCQMVGSVLSWLINIIAAKMPNKNLMRSIISIIFTLGIMAGVYLANTDTFTAMLASDCPLWIKIVLPQIYFLQSAIVRGSVGFAFAFVGITLVYAVISVLIIMLGYKKINTALFTNKAKRSNKPLIYKKSAVMASLLKKEAKNFMLTPMYFMNGIIGPLMTIIISAIVANVYKSLEGIEFAKNILITCQVFSVGMCLGIAPTTAVSINIEGSKIYTLKSLPVKFKTIAISKILFNIILFSPFVIISNIVFFCLVPITALQFVLMLALNLMVILLYSHLGLLINLKFPKLNWTTEAQAVKQGASMLTTMFIDMAISIAPMIIYFAILDNIMSFPIAGYLGIVLAITTAITITVISLTFTTGKKLYKKI